MVRKNSQQTLNWAEQSNILPSTQSGFRKNKVATTKFYASTNQTIGITNEHSLQTTQSKRKSTNIINAFFVDALCIWYNSISKSENQKLYNMFTTAGHRKNYKNYMKWDLRSKSKENRWVSLGLYFLKSSRRVARSWKASWTATIRRRQENPKLLLKKAWAVSVALAALIVLIFFNSYVSIVPVPSQSTTISWFNYAIK